MTGIDDDLGPLDDVEPLPVCPTCLDLGWVLEGDATRTPLLLDFLPCPDLDTCTASGRAVETLATFGAFARANLHAQTRAVVSLQGARVADVGLPVSRTPGTSTGPPTRVPHPSPFPPGARTTRGGGL